jgi:excisionase family DNA binding protein
MNRDDLLTAEQAQEALGVSRATLWNLLKRHKIPRYQIPASGRRVFFKRDDIERLKQPVLLEDARGKAAA